MADSHTEKYSNFLDGLRAYLDREAPPARKRKGADMSALLAWRDQPSGGQVSSNWETAANDNRAAGPDIDQEEANYAPEVVREIAPGGNNISDEGAIMKSVQRGEYGELPDFALIPRERPAPARRSSGYPVGGDVEFGTHVDDAGVGHKVVTRIGKLTFSDGTQTELALVRDANGQVVEKRVCMPVGAMLGARERVRQEKGGTAVWGATNTTWRKWLGNPQPAQKVGSGPVRRGKSYTPADSRAMLAEAIANTPVMPSVTKCPPGLPHKPDRVADIFLAGKKDKCAGGGASSWQEDASALVAADQWKKVRAEMLETDVAVLDAAMTAKSYGDIAAAVGKSRKAGPRLLRAANDNLAAAIKKYVA